MIARTEHMIVLIREGTVSHPRGEYFHNVDGGWRDVAELEAEDWEFQSMEQAGGYDVPVAVFTRTTWVHGKRHSWNEDSPVEVAGSGGANE